MVAWVGAFTAFYAASVACVQSVSYTHLDVYKRQLEFMADHEYTPTVKRIGIPDKFVQHGTVAELYQLCGCLLYTSRCV